MNDEPRDVEPSKATKVKLLTNQPFQVCRACGLERLVWGELNDGKYYLFNEDGSVHECPVKPLPNLAELKLITAQTLHQKIKAAKELKSSYRRIKRGKLRCHYD